MNFKRRLNINFHSEFRFIGKGLCLRVFLICLCWLTILAGAPASGISLNPKSRPASRAFYNTYYKASEGAVIGWTGNHSACDAGETAEDFRDAVLLRLNYFRAMAGVPSGIVLSDVYNGKAQEAAFMMSVNKALSHSPPPSWTCYSADGAEAASNSNLSLGVLGPMAITGYMKDPGSGNYAVGHRRWILYPQTQTMGTGDIPYVSNYLPSNSLWVFDSNLFGPRPPTREEFVSWPAPGYVPYQVVFPRWSFSYPSANFGAATVTMTRGGVNISVALEVIATGYGENTIVWIPNQMNNGDIWPKPDKDTTFSVVISNVIINGIARNFQYDVTIFDPDVLRAAVVDYDGDLKADVTVYDGATGHWFFHYSKNGSYGFDAIGVGGGSQWNPVSGDFDGDGKADVAIYDTINGWWLFHMSSGAWEYDHIGMGGTGFTPVPGDYDGDGISDLAVYQPSTGNWFFKYSSGTYGYFNLGGPGKVPVIADYDGDGKTDIAVYETATGYWYFYYSKSSTYGFDAIGVGGGPQWTPVPGDYDGDGKADVAVYDTVYGWWLFHFSAGGYFYDHVGQGGPGFAPMAGDYDGDGIADMTVYSESSGNWFFKYSSGTYGFDNLGGPGRVPVR
jgi:uncharacterized protein YkwD